MVLLESLEAKKIMAAERLLQASMAKSRLRGDSAGISWPVKRMGTGSQLGLMWLPNKKHGFWEVFNGGRDSSLIWTKNIYEVDDG